ncbi:MAG TPA: hypothetical protein VL123_01880 [Candidatus Udaeobacter sp.]|nr:hypothetical protein [Candidatus Udaeobacter sp.]
MTRPARACARSILAVVAVALSGILAGTLPASAAGVLYGSTSYGEYLSIDLATGHGTLLGYLPFGVTTGATEIEYDPISGRAFMQARDGTFQGSEFNPLNGSAIGGPIADGGSFTGLEFIGSVLYGTVIYGACASSELRILDPWSGSSTLIGSTGVGPISGLAYDAGTATLFGITGCSAGHSKLLRLDVSTGAATVLATLGFEAGSLEFGPDGKLYAGGSYQGSGAFFRIDPVAGTGTFIGYTGFVSLTGLMLGPECHSSYADIRLAGTFTSPPYDLPTSPAMTNVSGCSWQVTRHLDAGMYDIKFVTGGVLDTPPDYGDTTGVARTLPGSGFPTVPVSSAGHAIRIQVLNPDDYTFTLDEGTRLWSATAAGGTPSGSISGTVAFEAGFDFPPYPPATVEFFRGSTLIATQLTDRYSPTFDLPGLAPGSDFRVRVSAPLFGPVERSPIAVGTGPVDLGSILLSSLPSSYSRMDLVGDFNSFAVGANPMIQTLNGFWSTHQTLTAGDHYFKFATNGALDTPPDYGNTPSGPVIFYPPASGDVALGTGPETALRLYAFEAGDYQFNLDERNLTFQAFELPPPIPAIDINQVRMVVSNAGSFSYDQQTGAAGLEFPKGSGKTAVFAAGLWLSAGANVAISEYSDEFAPGSMIGGVPDNPNQPVYKVYKLNRHYASTADRDAALTQYNDGAVPHGAPPVALLPSGDLDILGDQMLWHVYNDADPNQHTNRAGMTAPLGVEIQQTTFGFNRPGALGNTVFMRFKIMNKGANSLTDMRIGVWSDPDLGDYLDDLVGCDPARGLGFCYNGDNDDAIYGATPPAVGFDLLQGPTPPGGGPRLGTTAFIKYINGTDPSSSTQTINYLHGLNSDGSAIINPTNGQPTLFMVSGDPVAGTGWLDSNPSDRRMLLCSGPFTMAPGDTQEIYVAIVIGQAANRFASLSALELSDDEVQNIFDSGFSNPTGTEISLVSADLEPGRVHIVWHATDRAATAIVYRADPSTSWQPVGMVTADGTGRMEFVDTQVRPGGHYGYRLGVRDGTSEFAAGEVWVTVPVALELALEGPHPNPARGELWVSFSLPNDDPASLDLLDVGGRRVAAIDAGALGAGIHRLRMAPATDLAPGVYLIRLRQSGRTLIAKAAIIR